MSKRPNLLDLRANSSTSNISSKSMRSPRLHVAGEAPPELSPLDAFALQSRLLAKQLQQENAKDGSRVSRLPPLTVESPLVVQGRSDYFRSMSADGDSELNESPGVQTADGLGLRTEMEDAFEGDSRPKSMHPRMSRIPPTPDDDVPFPSQSQWNALRGPRFTQIDEDPQRPPSARPETHSPAASDRGSHHGSSIASLARGHDGRMSDSDVRTASPENLRTPSFDDSGLAPPKPYFSKPSSSVTSSPLATSEDDSVSNMAGSLYSLPHRKFSTGSPALAPHVMSPSLSSLKRTPSMASDSSALARPTFNFSRPISRAGTPSFEAPSRQASSDSQPSFMLAHDMIQTPVSMQSEAFPEHQAAEGAKSPASSYIYSKFSLPRGKVVQRSETFNPEPGASFQWVQPMSSPSNVTSVAPERPPSPMSRPTSAYARVGSAGAESVHQNGSLSRPSLNIRQASLDSHGIPPASPDEAAGSRTQTTPSSNARGKLAEESPRRGRSKGSQDRTPVSADTSDTTSTIRPSTRSSALPSATEMSAEEHLNKGIKCHEEGSMKESTYHLRHAARQGNPTAMLLYALACRHGWGMRANQREGVEWLRKAAEYASVEIAEDEDQAKEGKHVDVLSSKTRKAQFALSIYELGVSHMNGWGTEQDKGLALRCFEIAGTWGDVDALTEAGFCYAQGIGTKKNLKKSAKFYRMAEAKGLSMMGNSWIHKAKYNDDEEDSSPKKDKRRARSKSRTRTMFGHKFGNN